MLILLTSCAGNAPALTPAAIPATATLTCTPTITPSATLPPPTATITPTPTLLSVGYNQQLLSALPRSNNSCLPDKTQNDLGIYIYDLHKNQELISINADIAFQFASAFKGPVLVYFLSQCKQYWDTQSPEWSIYFSDPAHTRDVAYYTSPEYKALVTQHLSNVNNWDNIEAFFDTNRFIKDGNASSIDQRYFILSQVYSMTTRSSNVSTGNVLNFVFEKCKQIADTQISSTTDCYQPNAVSQFNQWFNYFSGIRYQVNEEQRGLYKWDVVAEKDVNGNSSDVQLPTYGLEDACIRQTAPLSCSSTTGANVWSAKDFFKFYNNLYHLEDKSIHNTALNLLMIDNPSPARGNLKNLARKIGAVSMSKNGHAYFISGSISTDAGIFYYKNNPFIIVILGYEAQPSLSLLYGDYSPAGAPLTDQSLIQDLLDEYVANQ